MIRPLPIPVPAHSSGGAGGRVRLRVLLAASLALALAGGLRSAAQAWQPSTYDLSALPAYEPREKARGVLRIAGTPLESLVGRWAAEFRARQKYVRLQAFLVNTSQGMAGLTEGTADIGLMGHRAWRNSHVAFERTHGHAPLEIRFASGSYDDPIGSTPGLVFFVHPDNPLAGLTLAQLDGILGAARTGGWRGAQWTTDAARGPEQNIRTWGQLGLTGEWADKPVNTYGHAPTGATRFFQLHVLKNSDKWNPNYQGFVETGSKMISDSDPQQHGGVQHMLRNLLANDRYGIAWTIMPQAKGIPGIKPLALAPRGGGAYVMPGRATFQNRSYPLTRNIYLYLNRKPGTPLEPRLKEFLRFVLSREGQELVLQEGGFLPLTAELAAAQRARLE